MATLAFTIQADDTVLLVEDATGLPSASLGGADDFVLLCESEKILVQRRSGTTLWNLVRGYDGTTAARHLGGASLSVSAAQSAVGGGAGLYSARPSAVGNTGTFYYSTDRGILELSNGTTWTFVTSAMAPAFGWHDLKVYGAKLDGTTDDTAAVTAALAAAGDGHTVYHPGGICLVPDGGFSTSAKALKIQGAAGLYQDQTAGSVFKMTNSTGTLLTTTMPGVTIYDITFVHPSSGTRSAGLKGLVMTAANFNIVRHCMFSGFSTNAAISGVYWSFIENIVRDFILVGLDGSFDSASPDAGDPFIRGNLFDRTGTDVTNGVTGGTAVYLRNVGGTKLADNKINGPTGANGFDRGVYFEAEAAKTSTIVQLVGGSIQGCKTACLEIGGDATGNVTTVIVSGTELSGLSVAGSVGVKCTGPQVLGLDVDASVGGVDTAVSLQNVKHASIRVSGHDIAVSGVTILSLCRDIHIDPTSTFDGPAGVKAVVFDVAGIQNRAAQEYETWMPFNFSDASAHDMFEIGVNPFGPVFVEIEASGVNQGVGAFAHRLRRVVVGGSSGADSSVSAALPDEYTGQGALTSTFLVSGQGGPMKYQITKGAGTSNPGYLHVKVHGYGLAYFKQSTRDQ